MCHQASCCGFSLCMHCGMHSTQPQRAKSCCWGLVSPVPTSRMQRCSLARLASRSMQLKAWCYYESRLLGAHHGLISSYALEVRLCGGRNRAAAALCTQLVVGRNRAAPLCTQLIVRSRVVCNRAAALRKQLIVSLASHGGCWGKGSPRPNVWHASQPVPTLCVQVLVLYIFNQYHAELHAPLDVSCGTALGTQTCMLSHRPCCHALRGPSCHRRHPSCRRRRCRSKLPPPRLPPGLCQPLQYAYSCTPYSCAPAAPCSQPAGAAPLPVGAGLL